jgi:PHD/YefM family antitoxin component YafN of YafNO toxin-antitoxin module
MIRTGDIRKLSDFRQNATAHLDRLAKTGRIEVLTVNGEAKGVVMAPEVFDAMADRIEELETTLSIRRGLADAAAGRTRPAKEAIAGLAAELGLDLSQPAEPAE